MLNKINIVVTGLFFVSLIRCMNDDKSNQNLQLSTPKKEAASLKQLCFKTLIDQKPEKVRELFKTVTVPEELIHQFRYEVVKKASEGYISSIVEFFVPELYPDIALKIITERTLGDTDEKKRILERLLNILEQKEAALEHKIVKGISDGLSDGSERTLFAYSFLDCDDICLFQFLLKRRNFKENKIERLLNIPQFDEDSPWGKGKFTQWVDLFEKNVTQQIRSLQNKDWQEVIETHGAQKTAYFFGISDTCSSLLLKMHKLLYLGFRPSSEGFWFKRGKNYNTTTASFDNCYFGKKISCIDLILYSLKQLYDNEFCDCNYASLRFRLDGPEHQEDNAQFAEQIINFYKDNSRKSKTSYVDDAITDERYCKDRRFFDKIIKLKIKFYFSALRLLLPYCKEEFEKKKLLFARLLKVSVGRTERFICYNTFYDPASNEAQWDLYTIKNDNQKNNN